MKTLLTLLVAMVATTSLFAMPATLPNEPVPHVDRERFAGRWYSLLSIPTPIDKNWVQTEDIYTLRKDGNYAVATPYKIRGNPKPRLIHSALKFKDGKPTGAMKAVFFWVLSVDYWLIELADDYSYAVVGHPKRDYLYILSRTPSLPKATLDGILARTKARGYAVEKLVSQEHAPERR